MKVGFCRIGWDISFTPTASPYENNVPVNIIRFFHELRFKTTTITRLDSKKTYSNLCEWVDVNNINNHEYDALFVLTGSLNPNHDLREQFLIYKLINEFNGPVYFLYIDPLFVVRQNWRIASKMFSFKREEIEVTRKDISVITFAKNLQECEALWRNTTQSVPVKTFLSFEFEKFPIVLNQQESCDLIERPIYDLQYGSSFRNGIRTKKIHDWYFNHPNDISVEVFGEHHPSQFKQFEPIQRYPDFSRTVLIGEYTKKLNQSMSTIIIGDDTHNKIGMFAFRFYDSIRAKCVFFIEDSHDPNHIFFKNTDVENFCYINNKEQLIENVRTLKSNLNFRREILNFQEEHLTRIDKEKYCHDFLRLLKIGGITQ